MANQRGDFGMTSTHDTYPREPRSFGCFWPERAAEALARGYSPARVDRVRRTFDDADSWLVGSPRPSTIQALCLDPLPALASELVPSMLRFVTETVAAFEQAGVRAARVVVIVSVQVHRAWCDSGPLVAVPARSGWPTYAGAAILANAALPEGLSSLSPLGETPRIDHVSYYGAGTGQPLEERYLTPVSVPAGIEALYDALRKDRWSVSDALDIARQVLRC